MPRPRPLLDDLAVRATQRRAFLAVLAVPCAKHDARRQEPCWTSETATPQDTVALCGGRIRRAHGEPKPVRQARP